MENTNLIDELLALTLAQEDAAATAQEQARLVRLLLNNPQAANWYTRIATDSLTLREIASMLGARTGEMSTRRWIH
jgi:hypothetical protein